MKRQPLEMNKIDAEIFFEAITNPRKPNKALIKAANDYKKEEKINQLTEINKSLISIIIELVPDKEERVKLFLKAGVESALNCVKKDD